ncbi:hypothetical protein Tco_0274098, partial [Tanacetum coccineum]
LIDALLHHEVEGRVDRLVEEVDELAIKVAEVTKRMEALAKSLTLLRSSLSNWNIGSQNDNAADDIIHEDDRNANVGNGRNKCSYKDFVACKPKEFDGKGGAVAYIHWVKKMEAVQDISGCGDNQKVSYSAGSLTGNTNMVELQDQV